MHESRHNYCITHYGIYSFPTLSAWLISSSGRSFPDAPPTRLYVLACFGSTTFHHQLGCPVHEIIPLIGPRIAWRGALRLGPCGPPMPQRAHSAAARSATARCVRFLNLHPSTGSSLGVPFGCRMSPHMKEIINTALAHDTRVDVSLPGQQFHTCAYRRMCAPLRTKCGSVRHGFLHAAESN